MSDTGTVSTPWIVYGAMTGAIPVEVANALVFASPAWPLIQAQAAPLTGVGADGARRALLGLKPQLLRGAVRRHDLRHGMASRRPQQPRLSQL